jgi:hypothetical protein
MKKIFLSLFILAFGFAFAQPIRPGFSYNEYIEMLHISAYQVDTPWNKVKIEYPNGYTMVYRSEELALLNRWDLWISDDSTVVISIRGTTNNFNSWLENFYAAMVPASGKLQISESKEYNYHLSDDPKAGVHVGWLLALAYMEPGISQKIDSCINKGYSDFYITGHSQGGAIASLLTADLWIKKKKGLYDSKIKFKTYCSASPKPGNINFARQYSYLTQKGYAFNVINASDWVPEMPFTVQTLNDINELNPISADKNSLNKMGVIQKVYVGSAFRKVDKSLKKSVRLFRKYLGKKAYKLVKKSLVELEEPTYLENNYFVSAGEIIVLYPDSTYHEKFSKNPKHTFVHHMLTPYLYLANKQKNEKMDLDIDATIEFLSELDKDENITNTAIFSFKIANKDINSISCLKNAYYNSDFKMLINDSISFDLNFAFADSLDHNCKILLGQQDALNILVKPNEFEYGNEFTLQWEYYSIRSKKFYVNLLNSLIKEIE